MEWYEVKDNLILIGALFLGSLCLLLWVLAGIVLGLPEVYAIQYGIEAPPMSLGRLVIGFLLALGGGLILWFLKRISEY